MVTMLNCGLKPLTSVWSYFSVLTESEVVRLPSTTQRKPSNGQNVLLYCISYCISYSIVDTEQNLRTNTLTGTEDRNLPSCHHLLGVH